MENVNMLPNNFVAKRLRRGKLTRWIFAGLSVILLLTGYSALIGRSLAVVKQDLLPLERQVEEKRKLTEKVVVLEEELERAVDKQATVNELLDQLEWAHVLADISIATKGNAWLERLKFTKVKVPIDPDENESSWIRRGKEEKQEVIEIRFSAEGYAPSNFELANFMASLKKSSHFDNVELKYSELTETGRKGKEPVIEFEIKGTVS